MLNYWNRKGFMPNYTKCSLLNTRGGDHLFHKKGGRLFAQLPPGVGKRVRIRANYFVCTAAMDLAVVSFTSEISLYAML